MIRLDAKPCTFDFRPGNNGWGHALHTHDPAPPRVVKRGPFRKPIRVPRVHVLVHCNAPRVGDSVVYTGKSGKEWRCTIVEVERMPNVDDMYRLTLEETP